VLEKWPQWRGADDVGLDRVQLKVLSQATTAIQAFEAGEVDACLEYATCIPPADFDRVKETPEYAEFPALSTGYLGFNVKKVPLAVRRALALAVDRSSLVENVVRVGAPATSFTPKGMPGFDVIEQDFLPVEADLERARTALGGAAPKLTVFGPSDELSRQSLVAIQSMWRDLGADLEVKTQEWAHSSSNARRSSPPTRRGGRRRRSTNRGSWSRQRSPRARARPHGAARAG
jgi:oligopeptide transport system substrate-binding protein